MHRALAALVLVAAAAASACRSAPSWMKEGNAAPPIEGVTVDGTRVSLAAHKGEVVAVVFFADWCPHCRALYPTERELAELVRPGEFALLAVDADNTDAEIREAMRREDITWPVVADRDQSIASAWGVDHLPTTYLIGRDGRIRDYGLTGSSLVDAARKLVAETPAAR